MEVPFDEKWAFVAKKEARCNRDDPADDHEGDFWDYVALDPEHRLIVAVVPGAPTIEPSCSGCGHALGGYDPEPLRHQVAELPEIRPEVIEYRLHRLTCPR